MRIFGSVARRTGRPGRDVDLHVHADSATLLDLAAMEDAIERLVGRKVQVVSEEGLEPRVGGIILTEAVRV